MANSGLWQIDPGGQRKVHLENNAFLSYNLVQLCSRPNSVSIGRSSSKEPSPKRIVDILTVSVVISKVSRLHRLIPHCSRERLRRVRALSSGTSTWHAATTATTVASTIAATTSFSADATGTTAVFGTSLATQLLAELARGRRDEGPRELRGMDTKWDPVHQSRTGRVGQRGQKSWVVLDLALNVLHSAWTWCITSTE